MKLVGLLLLAGLAGIVFDWRVAGMSAAFTLAAYAIGYHAGEDATVDSYRVRRP